jgi:glycosyltransferase involved in cell wall biosynthesis
MTPTDSLNEVLDAVVMFTWSNWRTEPRSNRYHYAIRFARRWPVIFVQATSPGADGMAVEKVEEHDIWIVHAGDAYDAAQIGMLQKLLSDREIRRPLYWVYNPRFGDFFDQCPGQLTVMHATEDYLTEHDEMPQADAILVAAFRRLLSHTDLVIAVTDAVASGVRQGGGYGGPLIVARNGCDVDHWRSAKRKPDETEKIAVYQGGINARLDFDLLMELANRLPDWTFWFCGNDADATQPAWSILKAMPNVKWLGVLHADELPEVQARATVGIIPFRQISLMRASLPLKAYEYIASGLPVVTIPIDELAQEPDLFAEATDADSFVRQIEAVAATRLNPEWLERRSIAAAASSYDGRFSVVLDKLATVVSIRARATRRRNVLVLYDTGSVHVSTIREHLESLDRYSANRIHYMPAAGVTPEKSADVDLSMYDVVIVHYCVRLSMENHLMGAVARALERFSGLKIAFLQDEYETVDTALAWLKRLRIDILYTCIPMQDVEKVYRRADFPWMRIVPTLTGYIPDDAGIELSRKPMRDRNIVIGYRGRRLPHFYGDLGQEKIRIGEDVKKHALARGIPVDIEIDEQHRIYGRAWYEFLANARATLGTESGSNVFDFDGSLAVAAAAHSQMPYEEFRSRYLEGREGYIHMNQISPKIFEAIRLHVALVLFEGEYSSVVQPGLHYIPLKKDLSNIGDVFARLEDLSYLQAMTERAYRDIVEGGRYSYRQFALGVDAEIEASLGLQRTRSAILSVPTFAVRHGEMRAFPHSTATLPGDFVLPDGISRSTFMSLIGRVRPGAPADTPVLMTQTPIGFQERSDHPLRREGVSRLSYARELLKARKTAGAPLRAAEWLWKWTPRPVKAVVRRLVR